MDDVPVISFRNGITVSKVPLDVVAEGLIRLLHDTCQIPSGFGAWAGCLVVLDEGAAEVLPAIDGASQERLEPVEGVTTHHDQEVGGHDVVVAIRHSNGDGVGAQPHLGVELAIEFLDADRLEGRWPLNGSQPIGECGEAIKDVSRVVVIPARLMIAVVTVGVGYAVLLVVVTASLPLGGIPLAIAVVDEGSKIAAVETGTKIRLVDLLVPVRGRTEQLELDCAR